MDATQSSRVEGLTARHDVLVGRLQRMYHKRTTLQRQQTLIARQLAVLAREIDAGERTQRSLKREIETERRRKKVEP